MKSEKIKLEKLYSREKPLVYFMMWNDSDRLGWKNFLNHNVQNNLFMVPAVGKKGSVWYSEEESNEINKNLNNQLKNNPSLVENLIKCLKSNWEKISPFLEGDKKIENIEDFEEYYNSLVKWWSAMNTVFVIPDMGDINQEVKDTFLSFRSKSEKHTEKMSKLLKTYWEEQFPDYKDLSTFISPREVIKLSKDFDESLINKIKKRKNGCFMLNEMIYPENELDIVLEENNISLEKHNSNNLKLVNLQSRERSLIYCYVWQKSNQEYMRGFFNRIENIIFEYSGKGMKTKIWYGKIELQECYDDIGKRANDPKFFDWINEEFYKYFNKLLPYVKGEKTAKNLKELEEYYKNWIYWWAPMADVFSIPLSKTATKDIINKALKIRKDTEKYSDEGDRTFIKMFVDLRPKFKLIAEYMTPDEFFNCDNLTEKDIEEIKKRAKGYILFNGLLHESKDFNRLLNENNLELEYPEITNKDSFKGDIANKGIVKGTAKVILSKKDLDKIKENNILVTEMTSPDYLPAMKIASAFVTDEGGIMCHAAIVSRELKKPCIIGTKIATKVLKDGMEVEVDANKGVVKILGKK